MSFYDKNLIDSLGYVQTLAMARDLEGPFIRVISGYVNVSHSLELDPPLACRRWFARVADGAFCLYNTERACQSGEAPLLSMVLDKANISVSSHVQMLQLMHQSQSDNRATGLSFQVSCFDGINIIESHASLVVGCSPRTNFWTIGLRLWRSMSPCCLHLRNTACGLR
jgi:hypothetical protein